MILDDRPISPKELGVHRTIAVLALSLFTGSLVAGFLLGQITLNHLLFLMIAPATMASTLNKLLYRRPRFGQPFRPGVLYGLYVLAAGSPILPLEHYLGLTIGIVVLSLVIVLELLLVGASVPAWWRHRWDPPPQG